MRGWCVIAALCLAGCAAKAPVPPPPPQTCVMTIQDVQQGSNHNVPVTDCSNAGGAPCQCYQGGSE